MPISSVVQMSKFREVLFVSIICMTQLLNQAKSRPNTGVCVFPILLRPTRLIVQYHPCHRFIVRHHRSPGVDLAHRRIQSHSGDIHSDIWTDGRRLWLQTPRYNWIKLVLFLVPYLRASLLLQQGTLYLCAGNCRHWPLHNSAKCPGNAGLRL